MPGKVAPEPVKCGFRASFKRC